jgi:mitochondrial chaperone BCS1
MAVYNVSSPFQLAAPMQASMLEFFFPGFTRVSALVQQYTAIDLDVLVPLLCLCGVAVFAWKQGCGQLWDWVIFHFSRFLFICASSKRFSQLAASTVHISCNDEVYQMVISWVSKQPFAKHSRSSLVRVDLSQDCGSSKKPLHYSPWKGSFRFWYKGQPLVFRRVEKTGESLWLAREKEEVSISCFGWSSQILKVLLDECRQQYLMRVRSKTLIFENRNGRWRQSKERDIRPISTVLHDKKGKESLLDDIESFLDPDTRKWYADRGLPYRRGYLLYGPPGTGKSSLALSIAGHFHLDIYILNLENVCEDHLGELFADLPQHCVILLEDIDVASHDRAQGKDAGDSKSPSRQAGKTQRKGVTMSELLNVLDGVASQEGRVLVMTTNYRERLDEALIRPGRVDRQVEFRLADKDMAHQLFCMVFRDKEKESDDKIVERLADDFARQVPELEFSSAEVLSLLLVHRHSREDAVANVDAWVTRTREEKRKKLNREDSWEGDGESS